MLLNWNITRALESVRACSDVIRQMTEDELVQAIKLEEASKRRGSILKLLYRQSRVLARVNHQITFKEKLNGS